MGVAREAGEAGRQKRKEAARRTATGGGATRYSQGGEAPGAEERAPGGTSTGQLRTFQVARCRRVDVRGGKNLLTVGRLACPARATGPTQPSSALLHAAFVGSSPKATAEAPAEATAEARPRRQRRRHHAGKHPPQPTPRATAEATPALNAPSSSASSAPASPPGNRQAQAPRPPPCPPPPPPRQHRCRLPGSSYSSMVARHALYERKQQHKEHKEQQQQQQQRERHASEVTSMSYLRPIGGYRRLSLDSPMNHLAASAAASEAVEPESGAIPGRGLPAGRSAARPSNGRQALHGRLRQRPRRRDADPQRPARHSVISSRRGRISSMTATVDGARQGATSAGARCCWWRGSTGYLTRGA